jgi:Na+/melibiose symporter-like transporter
VRLRPCGQIQAKGVSFTVAATVSDSPAAALAVSHSAAVRSHESRKLLIFFGFGQWSRSLIWCVTDLLIGYHLAVRIGLSGAIAGSILFGSFVFGAVLDLLIAARIERSRNVRSTVLRGQALSGISSVVSGALLFAPPPSGETEQIVYVCLVSIIFRISYATLDVCQNALTSLLPRDRTNVRHYVLTRTVVSSIGRMLASLLVYMAMRESANEYADASAVAFVALPVMLSVIGLYRVASDRTEETRTATVQFNWSHLPVRRLATPVLAMVMEVGLLGLMSRLIPLFERSDSGGADGSSLVVAMVCGTILGPAIGYECTVRSVRHRMTSFGLSFCAAAAGAGLLVQHEVMGAVVLAFVYGSMITAINNIIWEKLALFVTDEANITGVRTDAMAFAVLTASINVAIGISNALLAVVLDGFKAGAHESLIMIVIVLVVGGFGTSLALAASGPRRSPTAVHRNAEAA